MIRPHITLDTGALIALERSDERMLAVVRRAQTHKIKLTAPAVAVLEWWRGSRNQALCLARLSVEPMTEALAKLAGEAIAKVGATPIDAAVMASAAVRGDVVYTSAIDDLHRLQAFFPNVRVLRATG